MLYSGAVLGYELTHYPAFNSNLNSMRFHPDALRHQVCNTLQASDFYQSLVGSKCRVHILLCNLRMHGSESIEYVRFAHPVHFALYTHQGSLQ